MYNLSQLPMSASNNLEEIINKGYNRAATSFASMIGHKVTIDNKRVDILKDKDSLERTFKDRDNIVLLVTSIIGALRGESYFLLTKEEEDVICKMSRSAFGGGDSIANSLILKEIDNILSAAVITEFSNSLNIKIYGDVPHLFEVHNLNEFKKTVGEDNADDHYILANANFEFDSHLSICPVFVWRFEKKLIELVEAIEVKTV